MRLVLGTADGSGTRLPAPRSRNFRSLRILRILRNLRPPPLPSGPLREPANPWRYRRVAIDGMIAGMKRLLAIAAATAAVLLPPSPLLSDTGGGKAGPGLC